MKKNKEKKICFICSSGGHFSELYKLKNIANQYNSFLVVENTENIQQDFCKKIFYTKEINRKEKFFLIRFILLFFKELFIFIKERPTHIVSTGALCGYPMMKIAKFFKKKIIYIESYARVYDLSVTGKRCLNIADLFIVQWPELQKKYPQTKYVGSLFGDKL